MHLLAYIEDARKADLIINSPVVASAQNRVCLSRKNSDGNDGAFLSGTEKQGVQMDDTIRLRRLEASRRWKKYNREKYLESQKKYQIEYRAGIRRGRKEGQKKKCLICGKMFCIYPSYPDRKCCSIKCRSQYAKGHPVTVKTREKIAAKLKQHYHGPGHPHWKGGESDDGSGHIRVWIAPRKYRLRGRLIIEKKLGRRLTRNEVVHHINGNKADDRIENLAVLSRSYHQALHRRLQKRRVNL